MSQDEVYNVIVSRFAKKISIAKRRRLKRDCVFFFLGGWAGKPGVAGAATEHPLERVESNEVRTRGKPPPS